MGHGIRGLCLGTVIFVAAGAAGAAELESRWGVVAMEPAASGAGVAVRLESVFGWVCEGVYDHPAREGAAVRVPLTCSDEVETKALMSVEDGIAVMAFNRTDGTRGSAKLRLD
ncbi:hypothetical protein [Fuscovulum ytuae]|uniref:Uncharacterized protein n=1 Tax=Fuscovulum ytuae TaxID=3042299 RepID=A0ABY8QAZ2_9RHOB|nr:hypothetical protein [Fuscovulum sp. YMD61]WGV17666.1 hypothetical protein QF092_07765 [Fuscovulum sp. YMD61]